ncbi:MAG TPA: endonuclease NucS domain-containing protein [Longimicrobiaceae bacterium]|jgi:hypothetical protein|nr:endonuclease NucS domain-containing protein [Longimicrobiaceae bacterium]
MSRIRIWKVERSSGSTAPLEPVHSSETERLLEDVLVGSPDLLEQGLSLVGRQLETGSGPLDLLGVDGEGRLVVFELKRGVLTRDAVAQVVDYASNIAAMDLDRLARWIEESSGRFGIPRVTDFAEWYAQEHPGDSGPLSERPRMVLVGLGVDERTLRMVNFLAGSGVRIELLTFQGFRCGGDLLLAKQVESEPMSERQERVGGTKESNRRYLSEYARERGVGPFLEETAVFVQNALRNAYVWPHKMLFSYAVADQTEEGRPTQRYIVALGPHEQRPGTLRLAFPQRVLDLGADVEQALIDAGGARVPLASRALEIMLQPSSWPSVRDRIGAALEMVRRRWEERRTQQAVSAIEEEPDSLLHDPDPDDVRPA